MTQTDNDRWIEVAKIGRAHGVRGEVRVFPLNPESGSLYEGVTVRWQGKRRHKELTVTSMRPNHDVWLIRFEGFDGRDAVQPLNGGMLSVTRESLPDPDEDEFYLTDLLGASVVAHGSGEKLGVVQKLGETNVDVLDVKLDAGGEVLVPMIEQYVTDVDIAKGTVTVRDIDHWKDT